MAARLTRQEMKRDEVLETASRAFEYITEHTRALILAVLAVLALVIVGVGIFAYFDSRLARANEAFAEALAVYEADIVADGDSADDPALPTFSSEAVRDARAQELFSEVRSRFGRTSVGEIAGVYLGGLAVRQGDTDAAREYWQSFLDSNADHMLATQVRLNLLALERSAGNSEGVVTRLQEQLGSEAAELPEDIALDQLASTLEELGRGEEAREIYQRIVDEHPASPYAARARQRLASL